MKPKQSTPRTKNTSLVTGLESLLPVIGNNQPDSSEGDCIVDTIAFWKRHSGEDVSPESAREMIKNVAGYFSLLSKWELSESGTEESQPR